MALLLKGVTVLLVITFTVGHQGSFPCYNLTLLEPCKLDLKTENFCELNQNMTHHNKTRSSQQDVEMKLGLIMNFSDCVAALAPDQITLRSFGNYLLNLNEKLLSTLVEKRRNYRNISFAVQNLEVHIYMVGHKTTLTTIPTLITSQASLDIDLVGISRKAHASVVFMSYTNMTDLFKPSFFDTNIISKKILMSAVVSFSLPQTRNTWILEMIDVTLNHTKELDPRAILSCMNWETRDWSSCFVTKTSRTHTVCSCYYGTTFALISETDPCMVNSTEYCEVDFLFRMWDYINTITWLPEETVENYLNTTLNLAYSVKTDWMAYYYVETSLYLNTKLVSKLWNETKMDNFISIYLENLEVQVFLVGPNNILSENTLFTSHASLDIDFTGITNYDNESKSVALLSYTAMADMLEPNFDDLNSHKALSRLVSGTSTQNFVLTKPVNFTLKHITEVDPLAILSCAHRDWYYWDTGLCTITQTNRTHTVCSCDQLETLTLFMLTMPCSDNVSTQCAAMFLDEIMHNTDENSPQELVSHYLNVTVNLMNLMENVVSGQDDLISFGNSVLNVTHSLVTVLLKNRDTNISFLNLEFQALGVESTNQNITFTTSHVSVDIQLTSNVFQGDGEDVEESVTFVSYNKMSYIFTPSLFKTIINTKKTMMSPVVSVSSNQPSAKLNLKFRHMRDLEPEFMLSCVFWNGTEWIKDDCNLVQTNRSHTECSCNHLGMFALIMETDPCKEDLTISCTEEFLSQSLNIINQELSQEVVGYYLNMTVNLMSRVKSNITDLKNWMNFGNAVLDVNENLVSTLVTEKHNYFNFTLQNLEVLIYVVDESNKSLNSGFELKTTNASMDVDLISIAKNNYDSAAVAFMSYAEMGDFLETNDTMKILMSSVVSATLPKTQRSWLTQPINITFKHIGEFNSEDTLSCVYWSENEWVELGCYILQTNSTHTQCSCDHLSVFALIKKIVPCKTLFGATLSQHCEIVLNMPLAQGVGIFFLTLCLLTFEFCCKNSNETNTALINLCLNLLLFDILELPKYKLEPLPACVIMNSLHRFFFISTFVWMFIETVLIFLFLKNISQIRSNLEQGLRWDWMNMIGYLVPVVVVIVCTATSSQNYVNGECWETEDQQKDFDIPVLFIVASNVLLYIIIITMMVFTLKQLRNMNLQRHNKDNTDLIMRVMFKSLAQFVILGCYWILRYIPSDNVGLYNVFLFLNTQQGTFIFIVHCLLNQEVRQKYRKILDDIFCFKIPGTDTNTVATHETQQ